VLQCVWQYLLQYVLQYVLQCLVVCCSVLQRVVACCSVLQCVAVRCTSLQRIRVHAGANAHKCSMQLFHTVFAQEPYLCWTFVPKRALFIRSLLQDPFEDAHECSMRLQNCFSTRALSMLVCFFNKSIIFRALFGTKVQHR